MEKEDLVHTYIALGHEPVITCASGCCWKCAKCELVLIDDNRKEHSTSEPCRGNLIMKGNIEDDKLINIEIRIAKAEKLLQRIAEIYPNLED